MSALALPPLRAMRAAIVCALMEAHQRVGLDELLTALGASRSSRASWSRQDVMQAVDDTVAHGIARLDVGESLASITIEFTGDEGEDKALGRAPDELSEP